MLVVRQHRISRSYIDSFDVWVVMLHKPVSRSRRDFLWRIPTDPSFCCVQVPWTVEYNFQITLFPISLYRPSPFLSLILFRSGWALRIIHCIFLPFPLLCSSSSWAITPEIQHRSWKIWKSLQSPAGPGGFWLGLCERMPIKRLILLSFTLCYGSSSCNCHLSVHWKRRLLAFWGSRSLPLKSCKNRMDYRIDEHVAQL